MFRSRLGAKKCQPYLFVSEVATVWPLEGVRVEDSQGPSDATGRITVFPRCFMIRSRPWSSRIEQDLDVVEGEVETRALGPSCPKKLQHLVAQSWPLKFYPCCNLSIVVSTTLLTSDQLLHTVTTLDAPILHAEPKSMPQRQGYSNTATV